MSGLLRAACIELSANSFNYSTRVTPVRFPGMDELAARFPRLRVVHPRQAMCQEGQSMVEFKGHFLFPDGNHLRRNLPSDVRAEFAEFIGLRRALNS